MFFFFLFMDGEKKTKGPRMWMNKKSMGYMVWLEHQGRVFMEENTCSSFADLSHTSVDFIFEMVKIENEMVKKSMGFYFIWPAVEIKW